MALNRQFNTIDVGTLVELWLWKKIGRYKKDMPPYHSPS